MMHELERFAAFAYAAGAKEEKEACAKVADDMLGSEAYEIADAIRARGQA